MLSPLKSFENFWIKKISNEIPEFLITWVNEANHNKIALITWLDNGIVYLEIEKPALIFQTYNSTFFYRKLHLIETIPVNKDKNINNQNIYSIQNYQYLLVLDFESTCWDKTTEPFFIKPEIIEFPTVLYKISTNEIIAEFQQYVMPMENIKLSNFCVNFTGISQEKVDNGIPLGTCLMLFKKWIQELQTKFGVELYKNSENKGNCIFVTWSDWDLGNCLNNECKRKRIKKPEFFKCWADLRALYKEFYNRRPQGLKGALNEVGLEFKGREHCGLHDARNTAFLAGRMIQDGALIRVTKEMEHF